MGFLDLFRIFIRHDSMRMAVLVLAIDEFPFWLVNFNLDKGI
jgi:hypothetical protein